MPRLIASALLLALLPSMARAQNPYQHYTDAFELRFARSQPVVSYTLQIDSADLSGWSVALHLRNLPDTFRLAMAAHPEYDDRYWRFVRGLRVDSAAGGAAIITQEDSAVWRVIAPGGSAVVHYRIRLPPPQPGSRGAWRPFLAPTGGLTGGPHAFMYILGAELAPAMVTLDIPASWQVATGLEPTADPRTWFAPTVDVLVESPILVGQLHRWRFAIDDVPHSVVYWALPDAAPFDSAAFVRGIEGMVRQAVTLFGRPPYREYTFLFQDGAYGALEHPNSVTLGAPSADLAKDPSSALEETAHEFFHTWNLMRIRPVEYRGVTYKTQPPVHGLWFSEGVTMFYADLLLRRAGPSTQSSRREHLEGLIARYLGQSGNSRFSAESVSAVSYNAAPGALGDYPASTHLQGELLGTIIDLVIRDATRGRRSMDDVMRLMLERYSAGRGFAGRDVERVVEEVCSCDVTPLFDRHIRGGGHPIDFDHYLGLAGLRTRVTWSPAFWRDQPQPDLRIWAWPRPDSTLGLGIGDPASIWARAGLHTGDQLVSLNGVTATTWREMRVMFGNLKLGDTVRVEVRRASGAYKATVVVAGYQQPTVRIEEIPAANARQQELRAAWLRGQP
jgi:predicted metalloprotease with PDZ domain